MDWRTGNLRSIWIGTSRNQRNKSVYKVRYSEAWIRAPYDQIICRLLAEDEHGNFNSSHEALRRQLYARWILNEFAQEFKLQGL